MEREYPSRNDSNAGTGVLDPETAMIAPSGPNPEPRDGEQSPFSTIATRVDHLVAVALSFPDPPLGRLKALKARIDAGTYQVTTEQVAEVLLEQMQVSWKAGGHRRSFGA